MYLNCRTFEDLCNTVNNVDFYELINLPWIKDIIIRMNQLGFFTFTSQPGRIMYNTRMYKSVGHRKHHDQEDMIGPREGLCRKQRAYIRGYMRKDMANYIIEKSKNDKFLIVRSTDHNTKSKFDDGCEFGSMIFLDDNPVQYIDSNESDPKLAIDADWSFTLGIPLRRPLITLKSLCPNLDEQCFDESIVEFDIVDKRWNNNDHLWSTLLQLIEVYHETHNII